MLGFAINGVLYNYLLVDETDWENREVDMLKPDMLEIIGERFSYRLVPSGILIEFKKSLAVDQTFSNEKLTRVGVRNCYVPEGHPEPASLKLDTTARDAQGGE